MDYKANYQQNYTLNFKQVMRTRLYEPIEVLLDDNRGIYIPQEFARQFYPDGKNWYWSEEDAKILLEGPDHELYWDVWEDVLDNAYFIDDDDGVKYTLYQDGDLLAIMDGYSLDDDGEWVGPEGKQI